MVSAFTSPVKLHAKQVRCSGRGPRYPIIYFCRHSTLQVHQDHHLEGCVGRHTRVLALYDISDAFWHALPLHGEPTAIYPPLGEEEAGYMWQVKRATFQTRRASRLFQEHTKSLVLSEAGYAALKVCYQVYYCPDADSVAAITATTSLQKASPRSWTVSMKSRSAWS